MSGDSAKKRALKILGDRQMSAAEMERRLISKGEDQETAQATVSWLEAIGAVNDAEYAGNIASHYSAKGYGMARIRDELYRRGIPRELWDDALENIGGLEEAAVGYLEKKLRGSRDKNDIRRATEALCRRGFSYDEARAAIVKHLENTEDIEEIE